MTQTIRAESLKRCNNWQESPGDFAVIIDAVSGKQIADLASPHLDEEESRRNLKLCLAAPLMLEALERAEFLMRRVSEGDHRALENLGDAARQCRSVIAEASEAV